MKTCVECQKKLSLLEGYKHPIKGKKYAVCGHCFDVVEGQVLKNREQVLMQTRGISDYQGDSFPSLEMPIQSEGLDKWLR